MSEAIRDRLHGTATILLLPEGHDPAGSSADAFMTLPFTSRRLLYRVRKVARTVPSSEIRAGALTLLRSGRAKSHFSRFCDIISMALLGSLGQGAGLHASCIAISEGIHAR